MYPSPRPIQILLSLPLLSSPPSYKQPRTTFTDPTGKQRTWESAERLTRPKNSAIDGVGIVAILEKPEGPELLLQKQFRPPIDKVCIEVPAGLVDEGESAEQCAVRELKEETGYVGEVVGEGFGVSPVMFNGEFWSSGCMGWEQRGEVAEEAQRGFEGPVYVCMLTGVVRLSQTPVSATRTST